MARYDSRVKPPQKTGSRPTGLRPETRRTIAVLFQRLDYGRLGDIYCEEGGHLFWEAHRTPCQRLGVRLAERLRPQLTPQGRSLYVGAGVAELPLLVMETIELGRVVRAYNLRTDEVALLNEASRGLPFVFEATDAAQSPGPFDHLWIVSVLNDPECFPSLSELSYGRADPVTFDPDQFEVERERVVRLCDACLSKLAPPALISTSIEELAWIEHWCHDKGRTCSVQHDRYPTAIVKDPICLVRLDD